MDELTQIESRLSDALTCINIKEITHKEDTQCH